MHKGFEFVARKIKNFAYANILKRLKMRAAENATDMPIANNMPHEGAICVGIGFRPVIFMVSPIPFH